MRNAGSALKFGKCVPVRKHQLNQEYAITIKHFTSGKGKIIIKEFSHYIIII